MPAKHLGSISCTAIAKKHAGLPKKWAVKCWLMLCLLAATVFTPGCDSPGFTKEELDSDPLPEFDDGLIAGQWLSEGELVNFEVVDHGIYLLKGGEDDDEVVKFQLKRVENLLIMEYGEERSGTRYFRPCVIDTSDNGLDFRCLQSDILDKVGLRLESVNWDNSEFKIVADTQDRVRQVYTEQANNSKLFAPTLRLTRPQPDVVLRARRAAVAGDAEAQEQLARYLMEGEIVERDREEALEWASKAASSGRPSAQVLYGDMLSGSWTPVTNGQESFDGARDWYERASEQQYAPAFSRLGHLYENAVFGNDAAAVYYYRRGAELGDSESHQQLGLRYCEGKGLPEDGKLAQFHLEQAPESTRSVTAWRSLALLYLYSQDPEIRNTNRGLHAAEMVLQSPEPDNYALAAEAAYENGLYSLAAKYQKEAISDGTSDQIERQLRLEFFENLAQVTPGQSEH